MRVAAWQRRRAAMREAYQFESAAQRPRWTRGQARGPAQSMRPCMCLAWARCGSKLRLTAGARAVARFGHWVSRACASAAVKQKRTWQEDSHSRQERAAWDCPAARVTLVFLEAGCGSMLARAAGPSWVCQSPTASPSSSSVTVTLMLPIAVWVRALPLAEGVLRTACSPQASKGGICPPIPFGRRVVSGREPNASRCRRAARTMRRSLPAGSTLHANARISPSSNTCKTVALKGGWSCVTVLPGSMIHKANLVLCWNSASLGTATLTGRMVTPSSK